MKRPLWLLLALLLAACSGAPDPSPAPTAAAVQLPTAAAADSALSPSTPAPSPSPDLAATTSALETSLALTAAPSPTPQATNTPLPTATPPPIAEISLGQSANGAPLRAWRFGRGELGIALVTGLGGADDVALSAALNAWQQTLDGEAVPAGFTLWVLSGLNPDGATAGTRLNGAGIDPARNADDAMDGCDTSTWVPDDGGGPSPFAAPETAAAAAFLTRMSLVVVFEHADRALLQADACRQHPPSVALAERLRDRFSLPLTPAAARAGHLADYLAGSGVAAVTMQGGVLPDLDLLQSELFAATADVLAAGAGEAPFTLIDRTNSGAWRFPEGTFTHPLALELIGEHAYLLDNGHVLQLTPGFLELPQVILAPGSRIGEVRVQEPLDLAVADGALLVLDRVGDVYRYDPGGGEWTVERVDRPVRDISSQFYVGVAAAGGTRFLLEASYQYVQQYVPGTDQALWLTGDAFAVDVAAGPAGVFVLSQANNGFDGAIARYQEGAALSFPLREPLHQVRQLRQAANGLWLLDQDGYRIQHFDPVDGRRLGYWATAAREPASAFWTDGARLLLAGRDVLTFVGEPERRAFVDGAPRLTMPQLNDPRILFGLQGLLMSAGGSAVPDRPIRLPGAPRHYRQGVHAGLDLYWQPGTAVRAVAGGTVLRADVDYQPPPAEAYALWRDQSAANGFTSDEAADFYRGRQVWIDHGSGLISRYAHLSAIAPGITAGSPVAAGQVLGEVGNSGSPAALLGPGEDAHLHVELWLNDQYLGQGLRPIETWEWLRRIYRNY